MHQAIYKRMSKRLLFFSCLIIISIITYKALSYNEKAKEEERAKSEAEAAAMVEEMFEMYQE